MNIFLLRHGETGWNREGRLQGRTDIPLNQNGRAQIRHSAEMLANLSPGIDLIFSSPLARALESAEIVADRLEYNRADIIVEPLLTERCFGAGEGLEAAARNQKYPDDIFPGMEPLEDLFKRAHAAFDQIIISSGNKQNILLTAHGAILYAIITAITAGQIAYGGTMFTFDPGSIHRLKYLNGSVEVSRLTGQCCTSL